MNTRTIPPLVKPIVVSVVTEAHIQQLADLMAHVRDYRPAGGADALICPGHHGAITRSDTMQMHEVTEVSQVAGPGNANKRIAEGWTLLAVVA